MGIIIRVNDADFSANSLGFVPPVSDGLEYMALFENGASLTRNLAPGKPAPSVVGVPGRKAHCATFTGASAYLLTAAAQSAEQTIIAVAAPGGSVSAETENQIVSNFGSSRVSGSGTTQGVFLAYRPTNPADGKVREGCQLYYLTSGGTSAGVAPGINDGAQVQVPKILACRYSFGQLLTRFDDYTDGVGSQSTLPAGATLDRGQPYRIGSAFGSISNQGPFDVYAVMILSRYVPDAEMRELSAWLRAFYASKGVSI